MSMKIGFRFLLSVFVVTLTPSCIKYHKMLKSEFNQGLDEQDQRRLAHQYIRSSTVYDQFTTLGVFDVLWVTPDVINYYTQLYGARHGKDDTAIRALQAQLLQELKDQHVFYVLADVRSKTDRYLHEKTPYWTIALERAPGARLEATSIKPVDLEPDYQRLFGYRYNAFKECYKVIFPRYQLEDQTEQSFSLLFSSPTKRFYVNWTYRLDERKNEKFLKNENCDWF